MDEEQRKKLGQEISQLVIDLETQFHSGEIRGIHLVAFGSDNESVNFKYFGANAFELIGALDVAKMNILSAVKGVQK